MTENARERLKMLITHSGKSLEECGLDGVLEELVRLHPLWLRLQRNLVCAGGLERFIQKNAAAGIPLR